MPRRDGTGPIGGNVNSRPRMGMKRSGGKGMGGSGNCICPKCGYSEPHKRGIPCSKTICPKCNTPLKGIFCK